MRHYDWLSHHAHLTPENLCWRDLHSGRSFSFGDAEDRCRRLAAHLARDCGVGPGDRVAVLAMNSTDVMEVHSACAKLGAVFVPLNWRLAAPEIDYILSDSAPDVLIYDTANTETVTALHQAVPHRIETSGGGGDTDYEARISESDGDHPMPEVLHSDVWTLLYTSGTTGRPKGAPNTYGMAFINAVNCSIAMGITKNSRGLTILPLFHTGGLNCYTVPLLHSGGASLIMRAFDPGQTLDLISDPAEGVTSMLGVPANWLFMSQHPSFETADFSRMDNCAVGGAPTPVPLVKTYIEKGVSLIQGFGMSETSPLVCYQTPELGRLKPGSAGRCGLHSELKIVREDGSDAAADEVGELWVRGPNIITEYWNRPETKATDWHGDWFRTGDAARMDADGDVWIVDRWKDMYISGGENVYPAEVENTLFALEGVADGAIVGAPDDRWGEVGVAFVVAAEGAVLAEDDVILWFHDKVARFKIPKRVVFVDELPRNATGKVLKRELREWL